MPEKIFLDLSIFNFKNAFLACSWDWNLQSIKIRDAFEIPKNNSGFLIRPYKSSVLEKGFGVQVLKTLLYSKSFENWGNQGWH